MTFQALSWYAICQAKTHRYLAEHRFYIDKFGAYPLLVLAAITYI